MFESPSQLALGLVTGIAFGLLLQKGRVAKFEVIVGQLLFIDWTVVKMMGTAIVVGAVGVFALVWPGMASLHIKPLLLGGVLFGAICFGIGMATLGYCPGTCVAGCGEGRRDAMFGFLGMLVGAALFVAFYRWIEPVIGSLGDWGEVALPAITGTSPWLWIALLVCAFVVGLCFDLRRRVNSSPGSPSPTSTAKTAH